MKFLYIFLFGITLVTAEFPKEIKKCNYGDGKCIRNSANFAIRNYKNLKGLHLDNVDPLKVSSVDVDQNTDGNVNLKMSLKNSFFHGTSRSQITNVVGFTKDIEGGKFELYFTNPHMMAVGDYKLDGKVMTLPVQGDGKYNISIEHITGVYKFKGKKMTIEGKDYLQVDKYKFIANITKLNVDLENLFNGDKQLGATTNSFLNENWQMIFDDIESPLFKQIGSFVKTMLNDIFISVPYADMFLTK